MCQRVDNRELEAQNMRNSKLKIRNSKSTALQPTASSLQPAFTLVEVLIVVAILALVAAGLVGVSSYLQTQSKTVLTEKCVELLSTAVAEFYDITGHYPIDKWADIGADGSRIAGATESDGPPNSDELLYLQLNLLPQTREIISRLPEKLLAAPHDGITVQLAHDLSADTRYLRSIVDPWHTDNDPRPLNYQRNDPDFPSIWSNGPDGTDDDGDGDDISNAD